MSALAHPPFPSNNNNNNNNNSGHGSYFPSPQAYHATSTYHARGDSSGNIDDLVYRYSAEFDRDRGTPTVGIYAQDGLWDDDESETRTISTARTARPSSSSASTATAKANSVKGRSRSGTVTTVAGSRQPASTMEEDAVKHHHAMGMWSWGRKGSHPGAADTPDVPFGETMPAKTLKKEKSKTRLRGKGRRGELSIAVAPDADESFEAPPPLPATPASFMTASSSPSISTASYLSPTTTFTSRFEQDHHHHYSSNFSPPTPSTSASANAPLPPAAKKSSWKRGMEKIFRSKSSQALRETFHANNAPPLPPLEHLPPKPMAMPRAPGKPFSSSTPPMPLGMDFGSASYTSRSNIYSSFGISPHHDPYGTPPMSSDSFGISSHPSLPLDPFASSLDLHANTIPKRDSLNPTSPLLPPRAILGSSSSRLSKNSPSLRDLKAFIQKPTKLSKAKSMANLKENLPPQSASTDFAHGHRSAKRMSSVIGMAGEARKTAREPIGASTSAGGLRGEAAISSPLPRPTLIRLPTESPPLLPPNPPYFPSTSSSLPSRSPSLAPIITTPLDTSEPSLSPPSPAPTSPLPAPPPSTSPSSLTTPNASAHSTMQRSASGHVLLPRSRSTSMSLKAPPTSSSFFDLYEQLGIWPTPEKDKEREQTSSTASQAPVSPTKKSSERPRDMLAGSSGEVSQSPSATFSAASWEAAISAFPIPAAEEGAKTGMNMGQVELADEDTMDLTESADHSFASRVAVAAGSPSSSKGGASSLGHSATQASSAEAQKQGTTSSAAAGSWRMDRAAGSSGSGGSSRESSLDRSRGDREERRKKREAAGWFEGSSSDEEQEEDDVPLSKLHPEAGAVKRASSRVTAPSVRSSRHLGRNPGAETGWDGEGGVPPDVLSRRLQGVAISRESQHGLGATSVSRHRTRTEPGPPQRSVTDPSHTTLPIETRAQAMLQRSQTVRRDSSPRITSPTSSRFPSPIIPHPPAFERRPSHPASTSSTAPSRSNTSRQPAATAPMSRTNTTRSSRGATSQAHTRASTEPLPRRDGLHANAFLNSLDGKRVVLDIWPETTARDVLSQAYARGDLGEAERGCGWVVVEVFAELGAERQVREYEHLQSVVKGWDPSNKFNCFMFKQSNCAGVTWTVTIPKNAPMAGGWVQYETKKGKWSKRWLETRGGQVFSAKNEQNKDEIQINSLFHDVYAVNRPYSAPKPSVFFVKRIEPCAAFEDPADYMHVFSCDDSVSQKLVSAIYDAKSHAIAQSTPHLLAAEVQRRPTLPGGAAPLVDLHKEEGRSAFTGKGLLKV